jgi:hypothetical protein
VAAEQRTKRQGGPGPPNVEERRGADLLPHSVRAAVPPSLRRGLRRTFGRERP